LFEEGFVPKTVMRFSKATRMQQLEGQAALVIAKEQKDPMYAQYMMANKRRLALKAKIEKKYLSKATQRAKATISQIH
jgi:hypothetical protein